MLNMIRMKYQITSWEKERKKLIEPTYQNQRLF
jgi:hypothetical protein